MESPKLPKRVRGDIADAHMMGVKIPAHAEMNVIRPKMQLSGGVAPVSLNGEKRDLKF